jgi:hypothetical protein
MEPLTAKELEYIVDAMSNEDLMIKQSTAVAAQTQNQQVYNMATNMIGRHQERHQFLMNLLQQHAPMAPTQPNQFQSQIQNQ